jgi:hypothetical protein
MIVAKLKALAKFVLSGITILLVLLILLYAIFKIWEYRSIESKRSEQSAFQYQQKLKFEDLTKDQISYIPLMVGTPSLDYVLSENRNFIFTYLLSADYTVFKEAMEESTQMVYVGKQVLGSGCKKQACSELEAAFVVDPEMGQYFAAIRQNGAVIYYGLEDGKPVPPAFTKWRPNEGVVGAK